VAAVVSTAGVVVSKMLAVKSSSLHEVKAAVPIKPKRATYKE
jgi:hypothetical protein